MTGLTVHWEQIGEILVLLFVISLVFETALTPIFNWRFFAKHFEGKGIKTPITIAAAVALLWSYDIDIFKHIIDAFADEGAKTSSNPVGRIIDRAAGRRRQRGDLQPLREDEPARPEATSREGQGDAGGGREGQGGGRGGREGQAAGGG